MYRLIAAAFFCFLVLTTSNQAQSAGLQTNYCAPAQATDLRSQLNNLLHSIGEFRLTGASPGAISHAIDPIVSHRLYAPLISASNDPNLPKTWRTLYRLKEQGAIFSSVTRAPNGAIYFATKRGVIYKYYAGATTLFLDLSAEVSSVNDRGLNAIAASPDGHYLYIFYVRDEPWNVPDVQDERDLVLERISLFNPALRGVVLHGIPSTSITHTAGTLRFGGPDELFVGVGDDALNEPDTLKLLALDPDSYYGKVLRINPQTGGGLPDNPFWDGDPMSVRSKVYAMGFRNPFSSYYNQAEKRLYVGDVGEQTIEEINRVEPGKSYGWPCKEGANAYLWAPDICPAHVSVPPFAAYTHQQCGSAITGLAFWKGQWLATDYVTGSVIDVFSCRPLFQFSYVTSLMILPDDDLIVLQYAGASGQYYGEVMAYSSAPTDVIPAPPPAPTYTITISRVDANNFEAKAIAADGFDQSAKIIWNAIVHHNAHIHPDFANGVGATFVLERTTHPEGWVELCATLGASASCIRVN